MSFNFITLWKSEMKLKSFIDYKTTYYHTNKMGHCLTLIAAMYCDTVCYISIMANFLFACFLGLSSHSRVFLPYAYGDVTVTGDGLQILTYVRHS